MEEELRELFCIKIGLENSRFKKRMLKQSAEVLFERAYQIDTMLNLYELLMEMSQKMEAEVLKLFLCFQIFGFSLRPMDKSGGFLHRRIAMFSW